MYCEKCGYEVRTIETVADEGTDSKVYRSRCINCHKVLKSRTVKI